MQRVLTDTQARRKLMNELVPEATFKRRTRLNAEESEKVVRLACILASAIYALIYAAQTYSCAMLEFLAHTNIGTMPQTHRDRESRHPRSGHDR